MAIKKFTSKKNRAAIYERDNMECCYCGKHTVKYSVEDWKLRSSDVATLDHIVSQWAIAQTCESEAEFRRAVADPKNLVLVCNSCNASKQETELYIWCAAKGYDYAAILARIATRTGKHNV